MCNFLVVGGVSLDFLAFKGCSINFCPRLSEFFKTSNACTCHLLRLLQNQMTVLYWLVNIVYCDVIIFVIFG